jgi:hypothetical protein
MEDFVTYDIAVKLKEKGFDKLCLLYYTDKQKLVQNSVQSTICDAICINDVLNSYNRLKNNYTDVPTISQVLKWLREEKGLHIEIQYTFSEETLWDFEVLRIGSYKGWLNNRLPLNSYEEAALVGIEYVLDNLI